MSLTPASWRSCAPATVTTIGTSCSDCSRFCAVTMISLAKLSVAASSVPVPCAIAMPGSIEPPSNKPNI